MNDALDPADDRDLLAAELVLGLLEGEALREARRLSAEDPRFTESVQQWEERLSPLFAAVPYAVPSERVWDGIKRVLDEENGFANAMQQLQTRARLWRGYGAVTTALAAGLALVLVLRVAEPDVPQPQPPSATAAPVLLASLASEDGNVSLAVTFESSRGTMLVTPARMRPPAGRDLQLWVIPEGTTRPISLGLVRATRPQRVRVEANVGGSIAPRATIALSIEPVGGSPTGLPTGEVIATGLLARI